MNVIPSIYRVSMNKLRSIRFSSHSTRSIATTLITGKGIREMLILTFRTTPRRRGWSEGQDQWPWMTTERNGIHLGINWSCSQRCTRETLAHPCWFLNMWTDSETINVSRAANEMKICSSYCSSTHTSLLTWHLPNLALALSLALRS